MQYNAMGEYQRQIKQLLGLSLASREEIRREELYCIQIFAGIGRMAGDSKDEISIFIFDYDKRTSTTSSL